MKKTVSYLLLSGMALASLGFASKKSTKDAATFYVVCTADFHNGQRTPLYCVGTADNYDDAKQKATDHNKAYSGHDASACSGSCPGCN